jgi:hypothetical protein
VEPRRGVLAGLAVACVAVTFGPWMRSGSSRRTSYQVVRAAEELDVLRGALQPVAAAAWYFVPLVAALVLVALAAARPTAAAALLAVVGAAVALLAVKLMSGPFATDWGVTAGLTGGLLAVAAAVESSIHERRRRARRPGPARPG